MALKNIREDSYPDWYQNVVASADMAEVSSSPGCMVIKPWGYGIWERLQRLLDEKIKETNHENCYFPMFIPLSYFQKEAEHVEGFAKEMAVVTHSRLASIDGKLVPASPLDEPLIVRPTSETIIADSFSKWVHSYRDLPVMINQWANVVRWEMRPRLFLRTREFLWQEGHTAHSTFDEAEKEAETMLEVYKDLCENDMAMPVLTGKKPEYDKFPGAVNTYCIEAMMQDGRSLQAGTSHFLGQNFAKSANIKFVNQNNEQEFAYTTSWGVSTRLIGGLIMTHGDDEGMVVPPKLAPYQVVIIPLLKDKARENEILSYAEKLRDELKSKVFASEKVRVKLDNRLKDSIDKMWEWTRKGAPIIIEVGPKDLDKNALMFRNRIYINDKERWKNFEDFDSFVNSISDKLKDIQDEMLKRAVERMENNIVTDIKTPEEFEVYFKNSNVFLENSKNAPKVAFVKGKWSGDDDTIEKLKEMRISIRAIPFEQSGTEGVCLVSGRKATIDVIYARSY
ncbi:MAG: proline--tRNA ligase [Alphaproteobacteria bacterium]|nr:proline--tRNA ligase [Alphaproteobacteria bacterium]